MFARKPCAFASASVRSCTAVAAGGFFDGMVGNSAMLPSWSAIGLASRSASCAEKMGVGSTMPSLPPFKLISAREFETGAQPL